MTEIRLTNTKSRRKEAFEPIDRKNVRLYVCGPTVYDRAHLGNGRPVVVFDVLFRLLRHVYGEGHVTYVRNFTDVDDKINAAALARKDAGDPRSLEALIRERTDETIRWYHEDMDALGALRPTQEPRATEWIGAMIAMIEDLIAKGHAYEREGHVLFRVRSYRDYGALSGRSVDDMIAGARVEVAPFKEDPMDFVLWKPSDDELPGWDSPWGRGRPGWHIECSAMADGLLMKDLPENERSFDIHAGGIDLQFPHHENEIAQSRCAHPEGEFAKVWMHNEMLLVDGKKMSKSLGNFFTVRELIEEYRKQFAVNNIGPAIRLRFLQGHYRAPIDAARHYIEQASVKLGLWWHFISEHLDAPITDKDRRDILATSPVIEALADDLNTPLAVTYIDGLVSRLRGGIQKQGYVDAEMDDLEMVAKRARVAIEFLGFTFDDLEEHHGPVQLKRLKERQLSASADVGVRIGRLLEERAEARKARDFARSDAIRDRLQAAGVLIKDSRDGATWELEPGFDPAKLGEPE
ncbi:cysteine--tRNA ligase [Cereibacter sphaeroides]|uniref:Cysteine--tRNA ligase n=1 Tax=Cereibacter sphaeroides (strain KD131 / KCTC 12085) TaxID=557760 RepID=SYC_CERSK|nr:cysteine--tRNA ligase [Cereibacter sphaeroides]B9KRV8.1 RecName: Full=Cysteine--tRNA ligase; AltName: Full=Cysteinyl-tRNA synthetase; Short=CysRS [Cereibacter sphaeroides KD131]ACM00900.1 Cysteinyl-tRNA synthetase [Cereibacter sphaeroides KD131]